MAVLLGKPLMPWQQLVADIGGELMPDGRMAYRDVWVTVPRQNGKTTLMLSWEADRCLGDTAAQVMYSAQDGNAAAKKLVNEQHPLLQKSKVDAAIEHYYRASGREAVAFKNGSRIDILRDSESAGHGSTIDLAIIDEAFSDTDERREQALKPAMITRRQAQTLGISTAGHHGSLYLKRKVELGRDAVLEGQTEGLAYFEWSADDAADPDDPATWWGCMPALGYTVEQWVIQHERDTMLDGEFRRAYLNQWTSAIERVIPAAEWEAVCSPHYAPVGQVAFGVDVSPERESGRAAIVACDEYAHLELIDARPGVGWLSERVLELSQRHNAIVAVDTQSPAHSFADEWERAGVTVQRLQSREMAGACGSFYDAVLLKTVHIRTDPALDKAVTGARKRISGDVWYWGRKDTATDVSPLIAASIARWVAVAPDGPSVYDNRGFAVLG